MPEMAMVLRIIVSILLGLAAGTDMRARIIPNRVTIAVAAAGLLQAGLQGFLFSAGHLALVGGLFALCVGLFALGAIGGGDAKLVPAVALGLPVAHWPTFLLVMALAGGVIALAMLLGERLGSARPAEAPARGHGAAPAADPDAPAPPSGVPYGLAIAAGGLAALWLPA